MDQASVTAIVAGERGQLERESTGCQFMCRTTVVYGTLVMKVEASMSKKIENFGWGFGRVLVGCKEVGNEMERGYLGLVFPRMVA